MRTFKLPNGSQLTSAAIKDLFFVLTADEKEVAQLLEILDYWLPMCDDDPLPYSNNWDIECKLEIGGSEGVYLDVYYTYLIDRKEYTQRLFCIKTLHEGLDAFRKMGEILGIVQWYTTKIVWDNEELMQKGDAA